MSLFPCAPQTPDGRVVTVEQVSENDFRVELVFALPRGFTQRAVDDPDGIVFASRSRLARLGVNVMPRSAPDFEGREARFTASMSATVAEYGVVPHLGGIILPGLRIGRLVHCPTESQLTSSEIHDALQANELQVPADFTIDVDGHLTIRPHRLVYDLVRALDSQDLLSIFAREGGKAMLNRLQVARAVRHLVLEPGAGLITSCSMFLHRHYMVLDSAPHPHGQHLQAVVLDPISTRGSRIFLEFANFTPHPVVNPFAAARVYRAPDERVTVVYVGDEATMVEETALAGSDYDAVAATFDDLGSSRSERSYMDRLVAVFPGPEAVLEGAVGAQVTWNNPRSLDSIADKVAHRSSAPLAELVDRFGTSRLGALLEGSHNTLVLGTFPNFVEHLQICQAGLTERIDTLVFRRASFEHGPFLSARDHARLADYNSLGLDVYWCNDERRHVAKHIYRGHRGFFTRPEDVHRLLNALLFACYGSAKPLPERQLSRLKELIEGLRAMFGENTGLMTGGGPGAMQQVTDLGQDLGMVVGANFIETIDQETNQSADFYQTFQDNNRHNRQRWFEIAAFQIFCIGGVGTLEEIGLTLTDMKLGVVELAPLVFFGTTGGEPYWRQLGRQLEQLADNGRGPAWLKSDSVYSDDPAEVLAFYRAVLQLG